MPESDPSGSQAPADESLDRQGDAGPTIVGVGAAYIDVILTVPQYPTEDVKQRASACERRRGGNVPNTLDVLGQLLAASGIHTTAYLITSLPAKDSIDAKSIISSFPPAVSTQHAVFREDKTDAPTSYIIRSLATGSRTIVNYNEVGELSVQDFSQMISSITSEGRIVYHFEGRIPDVTLQCMRHLRKEYPFAHISVELEKPDRPGLKELAELANTVFHSKLWAKAHGYQNAEDCVRDQAAKLPKAKYLFCTWGSQGAAGVLRDGATIYFESCPAFDAGVDLVDTVGAGDTFIAAVLFGLYYRQTKWTLQRVLQFANEAAGRKVTQDGLKDLARGMLAWLEVTT